MADLSILIPARNEMFLARTIEDILQHIEADTEIIAVLDGAWAEPPVKQNDRVNVIYLPESIGQRAATNLACRLSRAKYVMKIDAHCSFDQGFDRKMIETFQITGDNITMVPIMRNLWAFDWKCLAKGTNIVTPLGLKAIEDIETGETIISGDGQPHKITFTKKSKPTVGMVKVKPYQLPAMKLTKDHLVKIYPYEYRLVDGRKTTIISLKEEWVEAGKLKDGLYRIVFLFSREEKVGHIEDYANHEQLVKLLGYFIAEGTYYHKDGKGGYFKITLCFNQKEQDLADEIEEIVRVNFSNRFGKPAQAKRYLRNDPRNNNKYMEVKIYSKDVVNFVKKFVLGNNAKNKRFVPEVLTWPISLQRILLNTMIECDGCKLMNRDNFTTIYSTSSKELSYQIFIIMLRLGYQPGIVARVQRGNFGNGNMSYDVRAYSNKQGYNTKSVVRGNEYLVSIYNVKEIPSEEDVYDLSVEGLPEILTESGVVHNCFHCGWKKYQGPTPAKCEQCGKTDKIRRKMIWVGKHNPQSTSYCFDCSPHFQYFEDWKHRPAYIKDKQEKALTETMSLQGSCWMLTRENYWGLGVCDEAFGSWGSQGIEVAVKTWLSGGEVLVNHKTWYAHMFRTQGGDFGFPYRISNKDQKKAKDFARDLFFNNKWDKQVYPFSWLIEKFWPVKGWGEEDLQKLKTNTFEFKDKGNGIEHEVVEPTMSKPNEGFPNNGIIYSAKNSLSVPN